LFLDAPGNDGNASILEQVEKCARNIFGISKTCLDAGSRQFEFFYEIRDVTNCRGKVDFKFSADNGFLCDLISRNSCCV